MNDARWIELAPAFVLGTLDADEARAFEARLEVDEALRAEVRVQRELLGVIADGAPSHTPPAGMKDRIMDRARAGRPIGSAPSVRAAAAATPAAPDASTASPNDAPATRRGSPALTFLALAATVAAIALGISNRGLSERTATLEQELDQVRSALADTDATLAARDSLLASFLGPDVRSVTLASTGQVPSARIFQNVATGSVVIAAFDLPPAPDGRVYQLWGIPDGENPVSLGTFQTGADGTAIVRRTVPAGTTFAIGAITEEPEGGSPQPTMTPFLVGTFAGD